MTSLKNQLIRLGSQRPSLRKHLRPVLDTLTKTASDFQERVDALDTLVHKTLQGYDVELDRGLTSEEWGQVHFVVSRGGDQTLHWSFSGAKSGSSSLNLMVGSDKGGPSGSYFHSETRLSEGSVIEMKQVAQSMLQEALRDSKVIDRMPSKY